MDMFLSEEVLANISYTSKFTQSLKTISLRKTPLDEILKDICIINEIAILIRQKYNSGAAKTINLIFGVISWFTNIQTLHWEDCYMTNISREKS